ncbi:nuclear transport factor 2 family protein [bacterium]|nr:nuclear transport factor 2 family protein [bacterium]
MNKKKEHDPRQTILEFVDAINRKDVSALDDMMSVDHVFIDYAGGRTQGRERMLEGWKEYFRLYPDYKIHVHKVFISGSDAALIGSVMGSHLTPEEESSTTFVWTARIADGLVAEWRIYKEPEK